jgi:hypothetical protein
MATNYNLDALYSTPSYTSYGAANAEFASVWVVIAAILAVVGGILVYALFMNKKNGGKLKGFAKSLYDFLHFDKLTVEAFLKLTYVIAAIFVTLASITYLGSAAWYMFFVQLVVGNIILRISYELILLFVLLWRNTEDIKKSLKK